MVQGSERRALGREREGAWAGREGWGEHTLLPTAPVVGAADLERESAWSLSRDRSLSRAGLSTALAGPFELGLGVGVVSGVLACLGVCWGDGLGVAGASTHDAACGVERAMLSTSWMCWDAGPYWYHAVAKLQALL